MVTLMFLTMVSKLKVLTLIPMEIVELLKLVKLTYLKSFSKTKEKDKLMPTLLVLCMLNYNNNL